MKKTNSVRTSERIAKKSSEALKGKADPTKKLLKELAGSSLVNRKRSTTSRARSK